MTESGRPNPPDSPPVRHLVVAVSLKMYLDPVVTRRWASAVAEMARTHPAVVGDLARLIVLPSLPSLPTVIRTFSGTPVEAGAQDLFWQDRGPYTGAVSGADLRQIGCRYVAIGHSERRRVFGEDDVIASRKLQAALRNGLTPIVCVGEEEHGSPEAAAQDCTAQLGALLPRGPGPSVPRLIVAYEPVWAIGTSKPAGPDHVVAVTRSLRAWIRTNGRIADVSVIYGGSAGPGLLSAVRGATDGLFLGRFAHDPDALRSVLDETLQPAVDHDSSAGLGLI